MKLNMIIFSLVGHFLSSSFIRAPTHFLHFFFTKHANVSLETVDGCPCLLSIVFVSAGPWLYSVHVSV